MKGNVDGEEAKARLKARKRMMDCFSDTRNKRQLEQINFTHFTLANRTCKAPERRHNHKVNFINSAVALKKKVQFMRISVSRMNLQKVDSNLAFQPKKNVYYPQNMGVVTFLFTIFCLQLHSLPSTMYFYSLKKEVLLPFSLSFFLVGCIAWQPPCEARAATLPLNKHHPRHA